MSIAADKKFLLDRMNSVAQKVQLGTLLDEMSDETADATGSHKVVAAGKFTTVGGDAAEVIAVAGLLETDIVFVNVQTLGTGSRSIVAAIPAAGQINVTMSGDPAANHILSYQVLRAV